MGSTRFALNKADLVSILKGAAIVAAAAVLTYLADTVLPNLDLGAYTALVIPVLAVVINTVRKWLTDTR